MKPDPPTICALHSTIESVSLALFENGHLAEAVEAAFKEIDVRVQRLAQAENGVYGGTAMGRAFDGDPPLLRINDLDSTNDENEQKGLRTDLQGSDDGHPKSEGARECSSGRC